MDLVQGGEIVRSQDPEHARRRHGRGARARAPSAGSSASGPGEKLHEVLVTEDEARHSYDLGDRYVIMPELTPWDVEPARGERCRTASATRRTTTTEWLGADGLRAMADSLPPARRMLDTRSANPGAEA